MIGGGAALAFGWPTLSDSSSVLTASGVMLRGRAAVRREIDDGNCAGRKHRQASARALLFREFSNQRGFGALHIERFDLRRGGELAFPQIRGDELAQQRLAEPRLEIAGPEAPERVDVNHQVALGRAKGGDFLTATGEAGGRVEVERRQGLRERGAGQQRKSGGQDFHGGFLF